MSRFPDTLSIAGGLTLIREPSRLLLSLRRGDDPVNANTPDVAWPDLLPSLDRLGLAVEGDLGGAGTDTSPPINHSAFHLWVRDHQGGRIEDSRLTEISRALRPHLDWVGPVFHPPGSRDRVELGCPFPHVVVIRPEPNAPAGEFDALPDAARSYGLSEVPEKSRYLGELRYFVVDAPRRRTAYRLRDLLLKRLDDLVAEVLFENMPMVSPAAFVPDDEMFWFQWNMTQIQAEEAWDLSRGSASVTVAVIDSGCDLGHADLLFSGPGLNIDTMSGDGSPVAFPTGGLKPHGTQVAGVIAAGLNNRVGVAGLAGGCPVLPLATATYTDVAIAAGIRYAARMGGAGVINMSFTTAWFTFWSGPIPAAIEDAYRAGSVLCASAGNGDSVGLLRPASHPLVMACGGSDRSDARWRWSSGAEVRGSDYGDTTERGVAIGVSVVAPAEDIPTTDITGVAGGVMAASPGGDYDRFFWMTSAAAPHVAGLAALLLSLNPTLSPDQVRRIIERTAEKVGPYAYRDIAGYANGTRHPEMGYGRLNAFRALAFADVMIRDWAGDDGVEPSTPPGGNFYSYSDVVIRPEDDGVFLPDDVLGSSQVLRRQTNHLYVRVYNQGPRSAREVEVEVRITPYVGLEFVFPDDWTALDATHVRPAAVAATFAEVAPGDDAMAHFTLSPDDIERLYGWTDRRWHPCVLAQVTATNDYAFAGDRLTGRDLIVRRNNIAQRNLSVVEMTSSEIRYFPFRAGNAASDAELIDIVIRSGRLAGNGSLTLCVDLESTPPPAGADLSRDHTDACQSGKTVFLDRVRIATCVGGCPGVLTLEKGSSFEPCSHQPRIVHVDGGTLSDGGAGQCVRITAAVARIRLRKAARAVVPFVLAVQAPASASVGEQFPVELTQVNDGARVVGGALAMFVVTG